MKKIFLLSLLSVLLLSAFSQKPGGSPEILAKINITAYMDDDEGYQAMGRGIWLFFYKKVTTTRLPNWGFMIECTGWGLKMCVPRFTDVIFLEELENYSETIDKIFEELIIESSQQSSRGVNQGSISKKISLLGDRTSEKELYLFFQMNWSNELEKPYNSQAEIIISKTNNLGF